MCVCVCVYVCVCVCVCVNHHSFLYVRLETKSCRILPLTYGTKYDMT